MPRQAASPIFPTIRKEWTQMSEQDEKITPEAQEPEEQKEPADAAQQPEQAQPSEEKNSEEKADKKDSKKKKDKGYTLTREQMEQMELAVKQLESVKDQYTRLTAEYDNYRKRTAREKETLYEDAKIETIKSFLAVYDNLERAAAAEGGDDNPHKKGLDMIFQQFKEILTGLGVAEIDAAGAPFDPERHNAVMHIEDESLGENVVADVFQKGFMLGDKVIRFATVRVAN